MLRLQALQLCPSRAVQVQHSQTHSSRCFMYFARADWIVHEATFDDRSAQMAIPRGHSTARMAGAYAAQCQAKSLLLTHFRQLLYSFIYHSLCVSLSTVASIHLHAFKLPNLFLVAPFCCRLQAVSSCFFVTILLQRSSAAARARPQGHGVARETGCAACSGHHLLSRVLAPNSDAANCSSIRLQRSRGRQQSRSSRR